MSHKERALAPSIQPFSTNPMMASLVPNLDHDVFLSYATVDNHQGWVTAFVELLRGFLNAECTRNDADRVWWDRTHVDAEDALTDQIRTKVQKSACLVVIVSKGYVASKWCRREREAFLTAPHVTNHSNGSVFLVDIGNLSPDDRPAEFTDIRGRIFWGQPA